MAKLNILGAISTGLIEGGKAAQTYGAMKLKEEYMFEDKKAAAAAATSDKQKFLIEQVDKHRGKILDSLKSGNPLSGTISLDGGLRDVLTKNLQLLGEAETILINLYMGGKGNSPEAKDAISTIMGVIDENNKALNEGGELTEDQIKERKRLEKTITYEGDEYKTPEGLINVEQMQEDLVLAAIRNAEKIGESDAAQLIIRVGGDFIEGIISQMPKEHREIVKAWLDSNGFMPETSDTADETSFGTMDNVNDLQSTSATPSTSGDLSEEQPNREPLSTPMTPIDNSDQTGNRRGPTVIPSEDPQGSEQGLISSAEAQIQENAKEIANRQASESLEEVDGTPQSEMNRQTGYTGSYVPPFGGPEGMFGDEQVITPEQDDIATTTNIPVESDEIEAKKKGLSADLIPFIKSKVSNDNGYSTVEGVSDGDSNLTSMTLEEIVKKYGNKAVGIGGFKPKEFIKTINKKYLGLSQEQLNNQVFSEEFQNQLIYLGLEEAGMTKFIKGEISLNEFQERTNNIFARIDERSSPKTGVISSDGSGLINKVLKEY